MTDQLRIPSEAEAVEHLDALISESENATTDMRLALVKRFVLHKNQTNKSNVAKPTPPPIRLLKEWKLPKEGGV